MFSREHFEKQAHAKLNWSFFSRNERGYYVSQRLEEMWIGYCLAAGLDWKTA